jgi:hypothetical protein
MRRLAMNGFGGVASGAVDPTFGAAVGWGIAPRRTLEGSDALVCPAPRRRDVCRQPDRSGQPRAPMPALPYLKAGVGMYVSSVGA